MFDLRYHVASLAAVFVALIIGILVGVGLAGSGVTKEADLQAARIAARPGKSGPRRCKRAAAGAGEDGESLRDRLSADHGGLADGQALRSPLRRACRRRLRKAVEDTFSDAGADPPVREISLTVPVDAQSVDNVLFNKGPQFVKYVGNDKLESLGDALGTEFASGGADAALEGARPTTDRRTQRQHASERGRCRRRADRETAGRRYRPLSPRPVHGPGGHGRPGRRSRAQRHGHERGQGLSRPRSFPRRRHRPLHGPRRARAPPRRSASRGTYGTAKDADAVLPTPPSG